MLISSSVFGPCSASYNVPSGPKSIPCGLRWPYVKTWLRTPAISRIVVGNRAVEIQPQHLSHVRGVVLRLEFGLRRQPLGLDWNAVVAELIVPEVADRVVQLAIRPDLQPSGIMVVACGESRDQCDRIAQRLLRPIVGKAHDLRVEITIRARGRPLLVRRQTPVDVCVARVNEVVAQVERQAQQPVLPSGREHLIDRYRHLTLARCRIHASDALTRLLRHPQHVVRAPRQLPRPREPRHHFGLAELLRSAHHGLRPILRDHDSRIRSGRTRRRQQRLS